MNKPNNGKEAVLLANRLREEFKQSIEYLNRYEKGCALQVLGGAYDGQIEKALYDIDGWKRLNG